jgi:hypothetical protein
VLKVFGSAAAAETAAGLLESNGVTCWLQADDCGGMLTPLDAALGVKLLVRPVEADTARALLNATPDGTDAPPPASSSSPDESLPPASAPHKFSMLQIVAGVIVGIVLCLLYQHLSIIGTKSHPYDSDGDGRTDQVMRFRDGQLIEQSFDRNFDGQFDSWYYYEDGYQLTAARADDNFDGEADTIWTYTNGTLATSSVDTDFNGTPDVTYFYKYEQCTKGEWRPNGTNVISLLQLFRNGQLIEEIRDTNMDGAFDVTIRYDAFSNPTVTNLPALRVMELQ